MAALDNGELSRLLNGSMVLSCSLESRTAFSGVIAMSGFGGVFSEPVRPGRSYVLFKDAGEGMTTKALISAKVHKQPESSSKRRVDV